MPTVVAISRRQFLDQSAKIFPRTNAVQYLLGLLVQQRRLLGGSLLRHGHQQLRQVDFLGERIGVAGLLFLEIAINILIRHPHTGLNIALMQAADQHTFPQLRAKRGQIRALFDDTLAQFRHVNLTLAGDHLFGLVNRSVVHPNAGFTGHLQLRALIDQSLQRIAPQLLR